MVGRCDGVLSCSCWYVSHGFGVTLIDPFPILRLSCARNAMVGAWVTISSGNNFQHVMVRGKKLYFDVLMYA